MLQSIISRIQAKSDDAALMRKLEQVLAQHEQEMARMAQQAAFAERLVSEEPSGAYAVRLLKAVAAGELYYNENQWVPNEYETLERNGLVYCQYGASDRRGLSSRTIYPTEAGKQLAIRLTAQAIPA